MFSKSLEYGASKHLFFLPLHMTKQIFMLLLKGLFCKDFPKLSLQMVVKNFLTEDLAILLMEETEDASLHHMLHTERIFASCVVVKNWFWLNQITVDSIRSLSFPLFLFYFLFNNQLPFLYQFCCTHFTILSTCPLFYIPKYLSP